MEFWKLLIGLQGEVLKTLARGKPFTISNTSQSFVIVIPHETMKPRKIEMKEIEEPYRRLKAIGRITRVEIEDKFCPRNPAYVAAILASLPGVKGHGKPIITLEM